MRSARQEDDGKGVPGTKKPLPTNLGCLSGEQGRAVPRLPAASHLRFQADMGGGNVLLDEDLRLVGVLDFNLSGRETVLNMLFRESFVNFEDDEKNMLYDGELQEKSVYSVHRKSRDHKKILYVQPGGSRRRAAALPVSAPFLVVYGSGRRSESEGCREDRARPGLDGSGAGA